MTNHQVTPGFGSEPKGDGPITQVVDAVGCFLAILFCSILALVGGCGVMKWSAMASAGIQ